MVHTLGGHLSIGLLASRHSLVLIDDSERNKLYLAHDVAFVSQLQESYQRDIRAEKPGAQQAFSVFMGCQKQYVLVVTEVSCDALDV